jgi:hypothetical protein
MNIYRDIPTSSNGFSVSALENSSLLKRVMVLLDEKNASYAVTQAAVWIVTDNPSEYDLLNQLVDSYGNKVISASDLAKAREIVKEAKGEKDDKTEPSSIKMYANFPTVPDFASFSSATFFGTDKITGDKSVSTFYEYDIKSIKSGEITKYTNYLVSIGFIFLEDMSDDILYYIKGDVILAVGYMDGYFCVMVNLPK